ncbi:MAG: ABC transporter permease [Actinomycetota bacterium]|nr:ABC transporter permease [Actinomycetota bacterium]MDQ6944987.1 ABC transporter permease [Actinomycetota bacterium]
MTPIGAAVRSELLKQHSTRTRSGLLAAMVALVAAAVLLHVFTLAGQVLAAGDNQLKVVGWGTSLGALFAAVFGALSITSEIRHGTIRPTLLATPGRGRVIAAKVTAAAVTGAGFGLIAQAAAVGLASAGLAARSIPVAFNGGDIAQLLAGGAAAAALWAAIGVGVGAVTRNQVGAVVGLCVWLLAAETSLIGSIPSIGKFAPGELAGALAGAIQEQTASTNLVAPALGGLLLVAYAAAFFVAGSIATTRRDIS